MKKFSIQYIGQKKTEILTALEITEKFKEYLYLPLVELDKISSITIRLPEYKVLIKPIERDKNERKDD